MHRGSLLTNKLLYMDDFFICVMEMGECYWWMWLEVDGGLVVHSMVVSRSTFTMNKHANTEWV